jgi:hypothetical protein
MNTKSELFDNVTQRIGVFFALLLATSLGHCVLFAAATESPRDPGSRP